MALQLHYSTTSLGAVDYASRPLQCGLRSRESCGFRNHGGRILKSYRLGRCDPLSTPCEPARSCASSRGIDELASEEIVEPILESCEDSSGSRMRGFSEIGFGDCCENLLCPQLARVWEGFSSGALLWSSAMVVTAPSLAAAPAVVPVRALPVSDLVAAAVTLAGALGFLQFFDELAKRDVLEKKLSRKLCHILSGMVFMLFWPLFSAAPLAKYLAAFAPAANGLRMIGLGLGLWKNEALVKAISREGSQSELLQGPLYYAITITVATLFFWRNSPVGACAVATLCAGDGFADIVGRKWGKHKLPYNSRKSVLGSVAFVVMASLACMGYVAYFSAFGFFTATPQMYLTSVGVALVSGIVESLPLPLDDNFTVPFTAIGVGMLLLPF